MRRIYAILLVSLCLVIGCQISPRRTPGSSGGSGGSGGGGGTTTIGQLYVATPNGILRFSHAEASNGNVAPDTTVTASQLVSPQHLFLDINNNRLYVASEGSNSIVIFDNASTLSGATTPTRVINGNLTGLVSPIDVTVDTVLDQLYVAQGTSILVFAPASSVNGNAAPTRTINMGVTIGGIYVDPNNDQLYFTDPADQAVDRLDSASTQDTVGIVGAAIAGPDTQLSQPRGVFLDVSGRLIISNSANPTSITLYPSAGTNTGDVVPVVSVTGSNTQLQGPGQVSLNRTILYGELYVADPVAGKILIFTNLAGVTGNVTPVRTINGSNTGLAVNAINGVAIDPTR